MAIIRTRSGAGGASVEVTTCSMAAQPLYHRTVTSLPIDSSNRNIVINWLVKPLLVWVYSTVRGYDTPSVPVHHRQVYDTTWLNFTKRYSTPLECTCYLVSLVEAEPDTKKRDDRAWVDSISTSKNVIAARLLLMCAYSRDIIVWLSYAHDLGQAALGAGREVGRPCVLATIVMIRTSLCLGYVTALLLCCCCCCHRPSHATNTPGS